MANKNLKKSVSGQFVILFFMLLILVKLVILVIIIVKAENEVKSNGSQATNKEEPKNDYYTSLLGVQNLVKKEQEIVLRLVRHMNKLDQIESLKIYLDEYLENIRDLVEDSDLVKNKVKSEKYLTFEDSLELKRLSERISANPLAVFKLLRRFKKELTDVGLEILEGNVDPEIKTYIDTLGKTFHLPTEQDLQGAANGLIRLQETYQLSTYDMAQGKLIEKVTGTKLSTADMQFIGVCALQSGLYATGVEWLYLAYQNSLQEDNPFAKTVIENHLRTAAETHNQEFLSFRHKMDRNLFSNLINSNISNIPELFIPPPLWEYPMGNTEDSVYDIYNFNALCRGDQLQTAQEIKNLKCWYSKKSFYNLLRPLRFEQLHENPPIFQVYDIISDETIKLIKQKAYPNLQRAKVFGLKKGGITADVRTSAVAWVHDGQDIKFLGNIPKVIKEATGLECENLRSAEELQVSCYGSVGGHYIPHLDSLRDPRIPHEFSFEASEDFKRGDRVATVMFYLTDVELGGGTAFPRLGVAAKPIKNSAVMWFNLKKNGERDLLTLHGGCPVLYGNKWVANKWIRLYEQFHVWKCSTDENE